MEQIRHFDRLTVSDSPDETFVNEEQIRTTTTTEGYTKLALKPSEIQSDYDTFDLDQLFAFRNDSNDLDKTQYNQLLLSNLTIVNEIPEDRSNNENQSISNDSDAIVTNGKYPQGSVEEYGLNQWSRYRENLPLYIRNQSRNRTGRRDISECDIHLQDLPTGDPVISTNDEERPLWCHGTSWREAGRVLKSGIKIIDRPIDLAVRGAFYLNDSYSDCYDWLYTNNSSYRGEHAMLIYKFNPWTLSNNGEETTHNEWRNIIQKRNSNKSTPDWSFTYQNSRPADHSKQGKNPNSRQRSDGTAAKQLIIRDQKMCDKMGSYCIACIFYEKIDDCASASSTEQSTSRNNHADTNDATTPPDAETTSANGSRYSDDKKKRKRKKSKDRSKARDSKRFREE